MARIVDIIRISQKYTSHFVFKKQERRLQRRAKYDSILTHWARSSSGRALHSHCRGKEFESPRVHSESSSWGAEQVRGGALTGDSKPR